MILSGPIYQKFLIAILVMGGACVGMSGFLSDQGITIGDVVHKAMSMPEGTGMHSQADRAEILDFLARAIDDQQFQKDGVDGSLSPSLDLKVRLDTMVSSFVMFCFFSGAMVLMPCFSLLFLPISPTIPPPEDTRFARI